MAKRFLTLVGLALLYLASLSLILILAINLLGKNQTAMLIVLLAALVPAFVGLAPFLGWAVKRVFAFQGEGQPVPLETSRAQIEAINTFDAPVVVDQRNGKLVVSWKRSGPRSRESIASADRAQSYELHMKFDEARHTVTILDRAKSTSWRAGLNGNSGGRAGGDGVVQGVIMAHEVGTKWGIRRNLEQGQVNEYEFAPTEIKLPIPNSILRSGWDVRYGIW